MWQWRWINESVQRAAELLLAGLVVWQHIMPPSWDAMDCCVHPPWLAMLAAQWKILQSW